MGTQVGAGNKPRRDKPVRNTGATRKKQRRLVVVQLGWTNSAALKAQRSVEETFPRLGFQLKTAD